jgi:multicomponent Na+:H+ antiporter subunit C
MVDFIYNYSNYVVAILIFMIALLGIIISGNLIKKLACLGLFQTSILIFYISLAYIDNGVAPIIECEDINNCTQIMVNPLPHVLMLTAIVVGVAILAVGLALIILIKKEYKTIESDELPNVLQ